MPDTTTVPADQDSTTTVTPALGRKAQRAVGDELEAERQARIARRDAPGFSPTQIAQLLQPINPVRVVDDGQGHASLSQQDVTAHLIRVFGFGGFDVDILEATCLFETPRDSSERRWDVCYRARVRLTVRDPLHREVAHYEDGSTGMAQNQTRGDAHDLAYKAAISLAKKRAAVPLGDQFGLSLYNRGQLARLVGGTLVNPPDVTTAHDDVQDGVTAQVSLGNSEAEPTTPPPDEPQLTTPDVLEQLDALAAQAGVDRAQITAKFRAAHGGIDVDALPYVPIRELTALVRQIEDYLAEQQRTAS